ncbi:hypothetical protein EDB80DRAFT_6048 [Ilyonectria destructans]|nr:hypothetical protein EDB80DRAFT_6048 [Ilyonectria destructans]
MDAPHHIPAHPRFRASRPRLCERHRAMMNADLMDEHHLERNNDYLEPRQVGPRLADWLNSQIEPRLGRPEGAGLRPGGDPRFAPTRRRTMVAAILPHGMGGDRFTNQGTFNINRDLLFAHFPRAQDATQRGILDLDPFVRRAVADGHPKHMICWALRFIFGHMERLSRTGDLDIFGAAEQQIEDTLDRAGTVQDWAACMHAMCVVLDHGRGLGCSDELLSRVMTFLEGLFQDVQNLLGWWQTTVLFEAFAGVFRATRRDLVEQLHRIWNRFDTEVREDLMRGMRLALLRDNVEGRAHRMYRALVQ